MLQLKVPSVFKIILYFTVNTSKINMMIRKSQEMEKLKKKMMIGVDLVILKLVTIITLAMNQRLNNLVSRIFRKIKTAEISKVLIPKRKRKTISKNKQLQVRILGKK